MRKIKKINLKKINLTIVLAIIVAFLAIITLLMPSKDKIKEVEVKKVEIKKEEMVEVTVYGITKGSESPTKYTLTLKEASTSDLLRTAVEDMVKKYSTDLELLNIYFSDDTVYYEFNNKDLSESFLNALQMTTQEITGMEEINLFLETTIFISFSKDVAILDMEDGKIIFLTFIPIPTIISDTKFVDKST